jgi:maleate cis-trans isomerase
MAEGITGWRLHVGVIFPTPVPPRAVLEFYEAVPEGVDMTTVSLTIRQLSDDDMDEAIKGMERAAKQLASFDVDLIYQSGVPPVVRRGSGFGDELADRLSQAAGLPAITDMSSVIDAMRTAKLKTLAMATPFEQFINDRLIQYLAAEKIEITNNTALGIKRNVEIRRLPIPIEYNAARFAAATKPDGIYIPCGGWGSIHNIELLEKDLDTTVVTWLNAMIWSSLRRGKVAGAANCWRRSEASATLVVLFGRHCVVCSA